MIALDGHNGQTNKHDGEVYALHVQRVAILCRDEGLDGQHIATAWMHDLLEDTHWTYADLIPFFPEDPEVVAAVLALTKRPGESNSVYYERLKWNPIAARVKLRDLHDNFSRNHLITDPDTKLRMAHKYSMGMDILAGYRRNP
jgi:(p)ppGpp synthase/HD superfamily hydrolase